MVQRLVTQHSASMLAVLVCLFAHSSSISQRAAIVPETVDAALAGRPASSANLLAATHAPGVELAATVPLIESKYEWFGVDEEKEYEKLMARLRATAEAFTRKHGRMAKDMELAELEGPTMTHLAELAGLRGTNKLIRGGCPGHCQGRGNCDYASSMCECYECFTGIDCGLCKKPCSEACGNHGAHEKGPSVVWGLCGWCWVALGLPRGVGKSW